LKGTDKGYMELKQYREEKNEVRRREGRILF